MLATLPQVVYPPSGMEMPHPLHFGVMDCQSLINHLLRCLPVASNLESWVMDELEFRLGGGIYFAEAMDLSLAYHHQEFYGWCRGGFRTFVYHRASHLVYFDNPAGTHTHLMAIFAALHQASTLPYGREPQQQDLVRRYARDQRDPVSELAEYFHKHQLGFFLSSQSNGKPCVARGFEETTEESLFLESYPGIRRI